MVAIIFSLHGSVLNSNKLKLQKKTLFGHLKNIREMRTITVYAYHYFEIKKTKIEISLAPNTNFSRSLMSLFARGRRAQCGSGRRDKQGIRFEEGDPGGAGDDEFSSGFVFVEAWGGGGEGERGAFG